MQKINVFYSLYAPDLYRGAEGDFENDLNPEALVPVSTVEVAFIPNISDAHFFIAIDEEEYYTDQGIKVDLMKFQSAHQAPPSRINGAIDVLSGIVSPGAFNAVAKGSNIKIVLSIRGDTPLTSARRDRSWCEGICMTAVPSPRSPS
ncbi:MAG: hypothetical protein EHJ95_01250 [Methanobacteriota archaeon]|nr:MAG: hypothetical protein EHJ95_01250 [Euryarchaeota archaeon]